MPDETVKWAPKWINLPDAEELSEFAKPLFYDTYGHIKAQTVDRLFKTTLSPQAITRGILDGQKYAYITVDGEEVGFLSYYMNGDAVSLEHIYISPEYRRYGIGTRVVEWLINICCTEGYRILSTQVNDSCIEAMRFFRSMGLEKGEDFGRYSFKMFRMRRIFKSADLLHMYYI